MRHVFVIALCIAFGLGGCADPFSSRHSQKPTSQEGTFFQPISPQIVLLNLENSYRELIITNFSQCLDSTFFFKYDFVSGQFDEGDSGWALDEELRLTESMFGSLRQDSLATVGLSLSALTDHADQALGDSAILYRTYALVIIAHGEDQLPDTVECQGTAVFTIIENQQGLWKIAYWEDQHEKISIPSWADYKSRFR